MQLLLAFVLFFVECSLANEDLLRDALTGSISVHEYFKRSIMNVNSLSMKAAAGNFINSIGNKQSLGSFVSNTAFADSCLNQGQPSPIWNRPIGLPINIGRPINFGGLNFPNIAINKRAEQFANRDYVFVLDTSGSVPHDQFEKAKSAIAILVESFCPSSYGNAVSAGGHKQVSVVLFGSTITTNVDFSESGNGLGYLTDKILSIKHRSEGQTATAEALKYVRENVLGKGSSRLNNQQVSTDVIVITDGQCNRNCNTLATEADALRRMGHGVNVFAMGVANARACELEIISGKNGDLAYGLGDLQNFDRFAQAVKEIAQENANKCA